MILVPLVFGVLYAVALLVPVGNLAVLPAYYETQGIGDATPWVLLVAGVAVPPVVYLLALLLGRGRPTFDRALILTVGLAATFALGFGIVTLGAALRP